MERGFDQLGCVGVNMNIICLNRSIAETEFEPIYAEMHRRGAVRWAANGRTSASGDRHDKTGRSPPLRSAPSNQEVMRSNRRAEKPRLSKSPTLCKSSQRAPPDQERERRHA